MSKGRSRHQVSRRRMYAPRQRDQRERHVGAVREEQYWLSDQVAAAEIGRPRLQGADQLQRVGG